MSTPAPLPLRPASNWLLVTALLTLAPHALYLPAWLTALCLAVLAWRVAQLRRPLIKPHSLIIIAVAVAAGIGVKLDFGHFFGKDPGIALLAVLLSLKLMESKSSRDIRVAVLLSLFLQLGLFTHDQTLPVALLALVGTLLAIVTLLSLHDPGLAPRRQLRAGTFMLLQAIPLLLTLFVLFPRIPGPLWGMPSDAFGGVTGMSDTMRPGSIAQLSKSEAIAFRADFSATPPPPAQRYWRGLVLSRFDGQIWRQSFVQMLEQPAYTPAGPAYDYRLTLEPHNQTWLFALDFPAAGLSNVRYASDLQLLLKRPAHTRMRFDIRSYPATPVGLDEARHVLERARQIPLQSNPRSRALAQQIAAQAQSHEAVLEQVLDEMLRRELTYTLEPPALGTHTVDEFLFDTRQGFCEHFAAAFVFLMRAADVPARVVVGYLGGEINPVDRSMVVRQSDAHAWAEVWLPGRGWVRVDPTVQSAPLRLDAGLAAALPAGAELPLMMRPAMSWLRTLRHQWEAVSNAWNQSVLGYDLDRQHDVLKQLGFSDPDWETLVSLLSVTAGALMLLLFVWAMLRRRRVDPLDRVWDDFCKRLARQGAPRHPWEGPLDYAERAADTLPRSARAIRTIAAQYARLRYGSAAPPAADAIRKLAQLVQMLKLR
jgi:transglutaminase-like putative cysteine protease